MRFSTSSVLFVLWICCILACQAQQGTQVPNDSTIAPETAKVIQALIAEAAGIDNAEFMKFARGGTTPRPARVNDQALSWIIPCHVVMILPKDVRAKREAELRFSSSTPDPRKLVELMQPTVKGGYWSAFHAKYITDVTCQVKKDIAQGVVSFDAGLYSGQVHYKARRTSRKWQINEFSLPVRDWKFIRGANDQWEWHDHFGHIIKDRKLPTQIVNGQVLLDEKPVEIRQLRFTLLHYPEFFFDAKTGPNGEFQVELPPGKYLVSCFSQHLSRDFWERDKSSLTADITNEQTELKINVKSPPTNGQPIDDEK